jgi:hypothetical protein
MIQQAGRKKFRPVFLSVQIDMQACILYYDNWYEGKALSQNSNAWRFTMSQFYRRVLLFFLSFLILLFCAGASGEEAAYPTFSLRIPGDDESMVVFGHVENSSPDTYWLQLPLELMYQDMILSVESPDPNARFMPEAGQTVTVDRGTSENIPGADAEKSEGRQASQKNAGGAQ